MNRARFHVLLIKPKYQLIELCENSKLSTKGLKKHLAKRLTIYYDEQSVRDWDAIVNPN